MNGKQTTLIATLIALTLSTVAFAQPYDAGFEGGSDDVISAYWNPVGTVRRYVNTATNNAYALFTESDANGDAGPGFARIYQDGIRLSPTSFVTFRYRFDTGPGVRRTDMPADAFMVRVYDADGNQLMTTALPDHPLQIPNFTQGVYYHDTYTTPEDRYDPGIVSREGPDDSGFYQVTIDASEFLPGSGDPEPSEIAIEFAFIYAQNGQTTSVALDRVSTCTSDTLDCCAECGEYTDSTPVNIVVMIDETYSTAAADFQKSKDAVLALVDSIDTVSGFHPNVAVGRFDWSISDSGIQGAVIDEHLTSDYSVIRNWYDTQNYRTSGRGRTPVSAAIDRARVELNPTDPESSHDVIILITDGWTNKPDSDKCLGGASACCDDEHPPSAFCDCICACSEAREAAETAATTAEGAGIEIFVMHYIGQAEDTCDHSSILDEDVANAINWLEYSVATTPEDFYPNPSVTGAAAIVCRFHEAVQHIVCDDGDPNTTDRCFQGHCVYE